MTLARTVACAVACAVTCIAVVTGVACSDPPALEPAHVPAEEAGPPGDARVEASKLVDPFGLPKTPPVPAAIPADASREVTVLGSLTRGQIGAVLRAHEVHVTNCAKPTSSSASSSAAAKGIVVVKLVIGGDGRVTQALPIESSMGRGDVEECIAGAVKMWLFPKPKGGGIAVVTLPFRLK